MLLNPKYAILKRATATAYGSQVGFSNIDGNRSFTSMKFGQNDSIDAGRP